MIGISMALTIAVCVAGFSVIYAALDGFTGDFVSRDAPTAVPTTPESAAVAQVDSGSQNQTTPQPTATSAAAEPTTAPAEVAATATPSAFTPDYQVTSSSSVYLRSGPGTSNQPVTTLDPATKLEFLNDRQKTTAPDNDGFSGDWMKFKTQDGEEGWIRDIDVGTYVP
ncbi:MAG: SH3 domain-containing protein [Thermomicrobiales bacterium]